MSLHYGDRHIRRADVGGKNVKATAYSNIPSPNPVTNSAQWYSDNNTVSGTLDGATGASPTVNDMCFAYDGSHVLLCFWSTKVIITYPCLTPFQPDFNNSKYISGLEAASAAMWIDPTGTKLIRENFTKDYIYSDTLSTPYDVTGLSDSNYTTRKRTYYYNADLSVYPNLNTNTSQTAGVLGMAASPDGLQVICSSNGQTESGGGNWRDNITNNNLDVPFDVSTPAGNTTPSSYIEHANQSDPFEFYTGLAFDVTGKYMFGSYNSNLVYVYETQRAWDIVGMTYLGSINMGITAKAIGVGYVNGYHYLGCMNGNSINWNYQVYRWAAN